jgi:hypothetical protein
MTRIPFPQVGSHLPSFTLKPFWEQAVQEFTPVHDEQPAGHRRQPLFGSKKNPDGQVMGKSTIFSHIP